MIVCPIPPYGPVAAPLAVVLYIIAKARRKKKLK